MSVITNLLAQIPATFWSFIIAGFFTLSASLIGIILTNRAHDRRLQTQLVHDRDLKNRDREMSLRKDIYLAAAEAVSAGLIAVSRFPDLNVPNDKLIEEFIEKAPSITKIQIIAKEETVRTVINFSGELNATFLRLFEMRSPLVKQKQTLDRLIAQIDTLTKERSRMTELMHHHLMEGPSNPNPHQWELLELSFESAQRHIERTMQEVKTLAETLISKNREYIEECSGEKVKLMRLLMSVILSIRKELELPIDESEFRRISEEVTAKMVERLKEFTQQTQSVIAAQSAATNDAQPTPGS